MTATATTPVHPSTGRRRSTLDAMRDFVVRFAPMLLLVLLLIVVAAIEPASVSPGNLLNVAVNAAPVAVLALGAMWILISGGLDLSAGFGVAMCALVIGGAIDDGLPVLVAFLIGIGAGMVLGLTNGILVGVLAMPAFIATLATMAATQGVVLLLGQQGTVIVRDPLVSYLGTGRPLGIPMLVLVGLAIAIVVGIVARSTKFGLHTYGLGSQRSAMVARGVPVIQQTVLVYVFSGVLVAMTAILLVAKVQIVATNIANTNLLLDAFAATIIGGTSLFGGKGTVTGTLVGAVIISLISTSLVVVGVPAENVDFFKGLTIVLAVVIDAGIRFVERRGR